MAHWLCPTDTTERTKGIEKEGRLSGRSFGEYYLAAHQWAPDRDLCAKVWDVRLDCGTLTEWAAVAERSPFVLSGIAPMKRPLRAEALPAD